MGAQVQGRVQFVEHVDREQMFTQQQLVRTVGLADTAQHGRQVKAGGGNLFRILDDDDTFRHIAVRRKQPEARGQQAQKQDDTRYPAKEFLHAQSGLPFLCSGIRERNQVGTTSHNQ